VAAGAIPAHAGETLRMGLTPSRLRVDPRSRGGDAQTDASLSLLRGRSPLTRGRRSPPQSTRATWGSIPAHAGETTWSSPRRRQPGVDPRSRGGDRMPRHSLMGDWGRSPLTRGRPAPVPLIAACWRSIPAHAGETGTSRPRACFPRVDPRSRGGDAERLVTRYNKGGRSPLTRGRRQARFLDRL